MYLELPVSDVEIAFRYVCGPKAQCLMPVTNTVRVRCHGSFHTVLILLHKQGTDAGDFFQHCRYFDIFWYIIYWRGGDATQSNKSSSLFNRSVH